jgi:hypothetical protein
MPQLRGSLEGLSMQFRYSWFFNFIVDRYDATLGDTMIPAGFPSPANDTHETFDIVVMAGKK